MARNQITDKYPINEAPTRGQNIYDVYSVTNAKTQDVERQLHAIKFVKFSA